MPLGLYFVPRWAAPAVHRGDLVVGCLPAELERLGVQRGYLVSGRCEGGGAAVVKRAVALAGSRYEVRSDGVFADKERVAGGPRRRDHAGRELSVVAAGVVPAGSVFVVGEAADSWDSRYFGPVPIGALRIAWSVATFKPKNPPTATH
jgi:conjugative transfer signal peptidase TraF